MIKNSKKRFNAEKKRLSFAFCCILIAMVIVCIGGVSATDYIINHGLTDDSISGAGTGKNGVVINTTKAIVINGFTKFAADASTNGYLLNNQNISVATCTFSGNYCAFSPYSTSIDTEYIIAVDQGGGSYGKRFIATTFPIYNTTFINWVDCYTAGSGCSPKRMYSIQSINITTPQNIFQLCNSIINSAFINFTFKDQTTDDLINATINSGLFTYTNTTGSQVNYTFANATANPSYAFCYFPPNNSVSLTASFNYAFSGYPQKSYIETLVLTNNTNNKILYLLSTAEGIYVTFQVVNNAEQPLSGVSVTANASGSTIASGTTGDDGGITLWLNPDLSHTFTFTKVGYDNYTTTLYPTQTGYTINLGGSKTESPDNYYQGITISISPTNTTILNNTEYNFNFVLSSSYWDVTNFGFHLFNSTDNEVGSDAESTNGGTASLTFNTGNNSMLYMKYYWVINGNYTNGTSAIWYVSSDILSTYSIKTFFSDLILYLDSDMFGLDNFGLAIFTFLFIFISTGIMSYKFGLSSPAAISVFVFTLILFFDVGLGIMDNLNPVDAVPHFITVLTGIVMVGIVFREISR